MERTFYLSVIDPIVRLDLVGALEMLFPDCHVIEDAALLLQDMVSAGAQAHLFVSGGLAQETALPSLREFAQRGGQVITIGDETEFDFCTSALDLPFTNEMIFEAVTTAVPVPPVNPPEDRT